ncbi:MAG TPA: ABC transporter permease [Anaerolineales bacterium]|nr:ABC transporter permease [Anaerolineales bacterium]HRQ91569.1 ABC transporter permease [Anaerolineales bacterium]
MALTDRVYKNTGWRLFVQTVIGRAYPRIIGLLREHSWFFFEVFLPVLSIAAYVFIYRAIGAEDVFIGFVVMGGAMTAFWLNILWSMSSQMYWEKQTGNLALYIMAPNSLMAVLLGMALGGLFSTGLRALVITLAGSLLFDVNFEVSNYALLFAVFMLTMVALYGMGMMTASLFLLLNREAWHYANLAQEPVYLASGFYFPIKSLNFWVAAGASIIPLTLGLDAMRQLSFRGGVELGFLPVQTELLVLGVLSIVFLAGARWLLGYMERLAVREGRLTDGRR